MANKGIFRKAKAGLASLVSCFILGANSFGQDSRSYTFPVKNNSWNDYAVVRVAGIAEGNYSGPSTRQKVYFSGRAKKEKGEIRIDYSSTDRNSPSQKDFQIDYSNARIFLVAPEGIDVKVLDETALEFADAENPVLKYVSLSPSQEGKVSRAILKVGQNLLESDPSGAWVSGATGGIVDDGLVSLLNSSLKYLLDKEKRKVGAGRGANLSVYEIPNWPPNENSGFSRREMGRTIEVQLYGDEGIVDAAVVGKFPIKWKGQNDSQRGMAFIRTENLEVGMQPRTTERPESDEGIYLFGKPAELNLDGGEKVLGFFRTKVGGETFEGILITLPDKMQAKANGQIKPGDRFSVTLVEDSFKRKTVCGDIVAVPYKTMDVYDAPSELIDQQMKFIDNVGSVVISATTNSAPTQQRRTPSSLEKKIDEFEKAGANAAEKTGPAMEKVGAGLEEVFGGIGKIFGR